MSSRLLQFFSSCLFVALISLLVLGQSRAQVVKLLPNPHNSHSEVRMQQEAPFARHGVRPAKAVPSPSGSSQALGFNFAPVVTYDTGVSGGANGHPSFVVADVNGDGNPDLLVANVCADLYCTGGDNGGVSVLLGNGDGTFQTAVNYDTSGAYSISVADVNLDGKPDLVVDGGGGVSVLLGNGDGTFQTAVNYSSGGGRTSFGGGGRCERGRQSRHCGGEFFRQ